MTLHTRSLTINERFFRQLSTNIQMPTQSVTTPKVSMVNTSAGKPELIQSSSIPELPKPVITSPTLWQQTMTHLGKYWGYYAFVAGVVIFFYLNNKQQKIEEEL